MESSMVNSFSNSNIYLIKDYFNNNLSDFKVVFENMHGPYWEIKLHKENLEVRIYGDIGFSIELYIDKSKYDLWQYDRSVNESMKTNEKNILYQLDVLKRFIDS